MMITLIRPEREYRSKSRRKGKLCVGLTAKLSGFKVSLFSFHREHKEVPSKGDLVKFDYAIDVSEKLRRISPVGHVTEKHTSCRSYLKKTRSTRP